MAVEPAAQGESEAFAIRCEAFAEGTEALDRELGDPEIAQVGVETGAEWAFGVGAHEERRAEQATDGVQGVAIGIEFEGQEGGADERVRDEGGRRCDVESARMRRWAWKRERRFENASEEALDLSASGFQVGHDDADGAGAALLEQGACPAGGGFELLGGIAKGDPRDGLGGAQGGLMVSHAHASVLTGVEEHLLLGRQFLKPGEDNGGRQGDPIEAGGKDVRPACGFAPVLVLAQFIEFASPSEESGGIVAAVRFDGLQIEAPGVEKLPGGAGGFSCSGEIQERFRACGLGDDALPEEQLLVGVEPGGQVKAAVGG